MPLTKAQEGAIARGKFLKRERKRERCQAAINAQLEHARCGAQKKQRRFREEMARECAKIVMKAMSDGKVDPFCSK
jgi:hypothetical protein